MDVPEETWFVSADPTAFDLIHSHLFPLRQVGRHLPMLSSAGYPLSELYRSRNGWSRRRASRADRLEVAAARALRSHRPGYWAPNADLLTVYTDHYRRWVRAEHGVPQERVAVLGQGLPAEPSDAVLDEEPLLGFIGRDFASKGGIAAVEAFSRLRVRLPNTRLIVVTAENLVPHQIRGEPGVEVRTGATREDVLRLFRRLSLLLAPTRADCGVPFTVIGDMRAGVPVILSDSPWLDTSRRAWRAEGFGAGTGRGGCRGAPGFAGANEPSAAARTRAVRSTALVGSVAPGSTYCLRPRARTRQAGANLVAPRISFVGPERDFLERPYDGLALRHQRLIDAVSSGATISTIVLTPDRRDVQGAAWAIEPGAQVALPPRTSDGRAARIHQARSRPATTACG